MTEVTIRANAPVLGLARGQQTRVERTPFVDAVAAGGRVSVTEEHCPAVEGILGGEDAEAEGSATGDPAGEPEPAPRPRKRHSRSGSSTGSGA